ncbi:hypothetical protein [Nocardioides sp. AE5]|uniref:hypothetical protein n=1 Tax=Nocardioides sp. AE5 TaxID=2962573 RepID=UPI002881A2C1|nr:hypothetical protein [Nocardioides sp. AE5]MDT0201952.1 hypothetical protein [Nocardioides sp. AE5]
MGHQHDFGSDNGRFIGAFGLALVAAVVVALLADGLAGRGPAVLAACGAAAVGLWCLFLRPKVTIDGPALRLRNSFSDTVIPLAEVTDVTVELYLKVTAAGRLHRSNAFSRTRREINSAARVPDPMKNMADLVEVRVAHLADEARTAREPGGAAVTTPAWPEIGVLVACLVASAVLFLV